MSDIIKRLEDANGMVGNDFSDPLLDAAKEIESLRKRVKERTTGERLQWKFLPVYQVYQNR